MNLGEVRCNASSANTSHERVEKGDPHGNTSSDITLSRLETAMLSCLC
jgi:hypothetical protein